MPQSGNEPSHGIEPPATPGFRRYSPGAAAGGVRLGAVAFLLAAAVTHNAAALRMQPHEVVHGVIERVMSKVNGLTETAYEDGRVVLEVFEQEISPHLDFDTITRWLAGERWSSFAAEEKDELTAVVRGHIVQVYAALLARGRNVDIEVDPTSVVRTRSAKVGGSMATREGEEVSLEFRLIRSDDSWKLYDLTVEGLSFARSLRAELAPVIDAGGVEGLKTYLDSHR